MEKEKFIGRAEKLFEFERELSSLRENQLKYNILIYKGQEGTGKSFLLKKLKEYAHKKRFKILSIDGHFLTRNEKLFNELMTSLGHLSKAFQGLIKKHDINFYNIVIHEQINHLIEGIKKITKKRPVLLFIDDLEYLNINFLRLIFLISEMLTNNRFLIICSMEEQNIQKILLPIVSSAEVGYKSFSVGNFDETELRDYLKINNLPSDMLFYYIKSIYGNNIKKIKFIISNYNALSDYLASYSYDIEFFKLIGFLYDKLDTDTKTLLLRLISYDNIVPLDLFTDQADIILNLCTMRFIKKVKVDDKDYIALYLSEISEFLFDAQNNNIDERNTRLKIEIKELEKCSCLISRHYKAMFLVETGQFRPYLPMIMMLIDEYLKNNQYKTISGMILKILKNTVYNGNIDIPVYIELIRMLTTCFSNSVYEIKSRHSIEELLSRPMPDIIRAYLLYSYIFVLLSSGDINNTIDQTINLTNLLKSMKDDSYSCGLLLDTYRVAFSKIPGFSNTFIIKSFGKIGIIKHDVVLRAKYLSRLAHLYHNQGNPRRARDLIDKILILIEKIENRRVLLDIYNTIGISLPQDSHENIPELIGYLKKSAVLSRELGDLKGEHRALNNLGVLFPKISNIEKAYYYLGLCAEMSRFNNDYDGIALISNNIATVFFEYGDWDKALEYIARSITYSGKILNKSTYITAISNLVMINTLRGNLIIARQYSNKFQEEIKNINQVDKKIIFYSIMSDLEFFDKHFSKAVKYIISAFNMALKYGLHRHALDYAMRLYEFYLLKNKDHKKITYYIDYLRNNLVNDREKLANYKRLEAMNLLKLENYTESIRLIEESIALHKSLNSAKNEFAGVYLIASVIYMKAYKNNPNMLIYQRTSNFYLESSQQIFLVLNSMNLLKIYAELPFCSIIRQKTIPDYGAGELDGEKRHFEKIANNLYNRIDILENIINHPKLSNQKALSQNMVELLKDSFFSISFSFKGVMNKVESKINSLGKSSQSFIDLLAISKKINTIFSTKELFGIIMDSIINILQAERSFIFLYDDIKGLNLEAAHSINAQEIECFPEDIVIKICEKSFRNNLFISDYAEIASTKACNLSDNKRYYFAIPLNIEQKAIGCLYLDLPYNMANFDPTHKRLAQLFAEYASIAIDKAHNIEELHKAMENLKTLDRLKSEFISIASHELRTPLVTIKGYLELLLKGLLGNFNDKQIKALQLSNTNLERLTKLVDNIIIFAEIDRGEESLYKELFDVNVLISSLTDEIMEYITERKQELHRELCPGPLKVYGDIEKIKIAFLNVLMNAIRFTPDHGKIDVRTFHTEKHIHIEISDNGIGMSSKDIPKIFDTFYEIQKSTYHKSGTFEFLSGGCGLGLPMTKAIVELHSGKINVESEPKKGSKFTIKFPKIENIDYDKPK